MPRAVRPGRPQLQAPDPYPTTIDMFAEFEARDGQDEHETLLSGLFCV